MPTSTEHDLMENNRQGWNQIALANVGSSYYELDTFRRGRSSLRSLERQAVGEVAGRTLLHLQCHLGLNAISWARLGAVVTAVDFAEEALRIGRELARELQADIDFICSNVYDLPRVLDKHFDIVYTDYGVLSWLPDLSAWAQVVAHFLKPGGTFHIVEIHPILGAFEEIGGETRLRSELFEHGPRGMEISATYADEQAPGPQVTALTEYSWPWSIGLLINALVGAGLRIEQMREVPVDCRQRFQAMQRDPDEPGCWRLPGDPLPLSFALSARKPG